MSAAPSATTAAPRPRRTLLIISLCVNFLLVGLIVGGLFVAWQRAAAGGGGGNQPFNPRVLAQMLPPDGRAKVQGIIRANALTFLPLQREARLARLQVYRAFRAEPFEPAAFDAAMDRMRAADTAVLDAGQKLMLEIATKLTPEERRIVGDEIRARRWQRRGQAPGLGGPGEDAAPAVTP